MVSPIQFASKLPHVGTTIFSVMSALATEKNAVNLGQGFPDFGCDPDLITAVNEAMQAGHNQYAPMPGAMVLREAIAETIRATYGRSYDPATEVTVTAGATQAILSAILCCVHPGDEVIVIEPAYDSYVPAIELAGGTPVFVQMELDETGYHVPWKKVAAAVTGKTRLLMINSPHNPTGTILRAEDIIALEAIVADTSILVLSDEVYEYMVYDGQRHESVTRYPHLAERSFVVSSFGKTYHVTGWKVGYIVAPAALMAEFRKVHQFNVFSVNTPMQHGIANYMLSSRSHLDLSALYQRKRDLFRKGLEASSFRLLPSDGTYFQCVDYRDVSDLPEAEFAKWLVNKAGVAAIPISAFYHQPHESGIIRFCYAKKDATLHQALDKLSTL